MTFIPLCYSKTDIPIHPERHNQTTHSNDKISGILPELLDRQTSLVRNVLGRQQVMSYHMQSKPSSIHSCSAHPRTSGSMPRWLWRWLGEWRRLEKCVLHQSLGLGCPRWRICLGR